MRIARHVVAKKDRLMVPIPAAVRDHLSVVGRSQVFWHTVRRGEVVLTASGVRPGGKPRLDADCSACAAYRVELDRLRGLLRSASMADYNTAFGQGVQQGVKSVPVWRAELDQLHDETRELARLVAQLVVRLPERKAPRRQRGPARRVRIADDPPFADDFDAQGLVKPRELDAMPLPDLPSSSAPLDGGDAASGAEPPGRPRDS